MHGKRSDLRYEACSDRAARVWAWVDEGRVMGDICDGRGWGLLGLEIAE